MMAGRYFNQASTSAVVRQEADSTQGDAAATDSSGKQKKFRCELCNIRLPFTKEVLEHHVTSKSHVFMKNLLDYGVWPGSESESCSVKQIKPQIYEFGEKGTGEIKCKVCMVILKDSRSLLQHQMLSPHWECVKKRQLSHVIPKLLFCEVCDEVLCRGFLPGTQISSTHLQSQKHINQETLLRQIQEMTNEMAEQAKAEREALLFAQDVAPQPADPSLPLEERLNKVKEKQEKRRRTLMTQYLEEYLKPSGHGQLTRMKKRRPWRNANLNRIDRLRDEIEQRLAGLNGIKYPSPANKNSINNYTAKLEQVEVVREKEEYECKWNYICEQNLEEVLWTYVQKRERERKIEAEKWQSMIGGTSGYPPAGDISDDEENPYTKIEDLEKAVRQWSNQINEPNLPPPTPVAEEKSVPNEAPLVTVYDRRKKTHQAETVAGKTAPDLTQPPPTFGSKMPDMSKPPPLIGKGTLDSLSGVLASLGGTAGLKGLLSGSKASSAGSSAPMDMLSGLMASVSGGADSKSQSTIATSSIMGNNPPSDVLNTTLPAAAAAANFVDVNSLLGELMQQEQSGADRDPRDKMRAALVNQLLAQRAQARAAQQNMQQLLSSLAATAQQQEEKQNEGLLEHEKSTHTQDWDKMLNQVLREKRVETEEAMLAAAWDQPKMCWIWDGDDPRRRDCIMNSKKFFDDLTLQQRAKEERMQEVIAGFINEEYGAGFGRAFEQYIHPDFDARHGTAGGLVTYPDIYSGVPRSRSRSRSRSRDRSSRRRRSRSRDRGARRSYSPVDFSRLGDEYGIYEDSIEDYFSRHEREREERSRRRRETRRSRSRSPPRRRSRDRRSRSRERSRESSHRPSEHRSRGRIDETSRGKTYIPRSSDNIVSYQKASDYNISRRMQLIRDNNGEPMSTPAPAARTPRGPEPLMSLVVQKPQLEPLVPSQPWKEPERRRNYVDVSVPEGQVKTYVSSTGKTYEIPLVPPEHEKHRSSRSERSPPRRRPPVSTEPSRSFSKEKRIDPSVLEQAYRPVSIGKNVSAAQTGADPPPPGCEPEIATAVAKMPVKPSAVIEKELPPPGTETSDSSSTLTSLRETEPSNAPISSSAADLPVSGSTASVSVLFEVPSAVPTNVLAAETAESTVQSSAVLNVESNLTENSMPTDIEEVCAGGISAEETQTAAQVEPQEDTAVAAETAEGQGSVTQLD